MLLKKRVERSLDTMNERNRRYLKEQGEYTGPEAPAVEAEEPEEGEPGLRAYVKGSSQASPNQNWERLDEMEKEKEAIEAYRKNNEKLEFEKGDIPALMLSALITFGPILLIGMAIIWFILSRL